MATINSKTPIKTKTSKKAILPGVPNTRKSEPPQSRLFGLNTTIPNSFRDIIPVIRQLNIYNEDVGQAIHNISTLANTGHQVFFNSSVSPTLVDKMRQHLQDHSDWATGLAGMDGLVTRLITQLLISGAASAEWVPNANLTGIQGVILVNPEEIEFKLDPKGVIYKPYQRVQFLPIPVKGQSSGADPLIPLNPNTYKYYSLNGDGELPYGFPPYTPVLDRISTQHRMNINIDYVVEQMGLMGFIQALIQKPDQLDGQADKDYDALLDGLLIKAKDRMLAGFKDGVVVGFKDDHEFDFKSASKSYTDAVELYKNNELMLASALKQDASMWGRSYATSETQITVVFIKMISELKTIHNILSRMLEFGYSLELGLAGFDFKSLRVKFNNSTITDELKAQQSEEIKLRNVKDKMILGIVNQDTAADELGYEKPAFPKPQVDWEVLAGKSSSPAGPLETDKTKKKKEQKKVKSDSATKSRRGSKPVPKIK